MTYRVAMLPIIALGLASCGEPEPVAPDPAAVAPAAEVPHPADAFMDNLRAHCGKAYRGELVEYTDPDDLGVVGEEMVMHVRECFEDEIRVPFHIGDDRSRTWIYTRTEDGLRLKHDHRHEDGSEDEVTQYGGDTIVPGSANSQAFPADAYTAELLPHAATNIWTVVIEPGQSYSYRLVRIGTERRFRVDFDLTEEVDPPPPPWGYGD